MPRAHTGPTGTGRARKAGEARSSESRGLPVTRPSGSAEEWIERPEARRRCDFPQRLEGLIPVDILDDDAAAAFHCRTANGGAIRHHHPEPVQKILRKALLRGHRKGPRPRLVNLTFPIRELIIPHVATRISSRVRRSWAASSRVAASCNRVMPLSSASIVSRTLSTSRLRIRDNARCTSTRACSSRAVNGFTR